MSLLLIFVVDVVDIFADVVDFVVVDVVVAISCDCCCLILLLLELLMF